MTDSAQKLRSKQCKDEDIIRWYKNYLTSRIAIVDIKGIKVTRNLHLGCPQGGVLSVIIWNLVFDRLLRFFDKGRLKCIGYADDACLVIHGPNLNLLYKYMNRGLAKADEWAKDSGLQISHSKTVAMIFTN